MVGTIVLARLRCCGYVVFGRWVERRTGIASVAQDLSLTDYAYQSAELAEALARHAYADDLRHIELGLQLSSLVAQRAFLP